MDFLDLTETNYSFSAINRLGSLSYKLQDSRVWEVDDVDVSYQAAKLFLQFYNDEFEFGLENLIRDFSFENFKRAFHSLK
jgi:hypothetical protein